MAKRKTKQQIEADRKALIRRRLMDIAYGANYGCDLECYGDEGDFFASMGPESFFGFIRAVTRVFGESSEGFSVYGIHNLEHFANVEKSTDWLVQCGFTGEEECA